MNILEQINFTPEKPAVVSLQKTKGIQQFAIGLMENQVLPKHSTQQPAVLIVLQGAVVFNIHGEAHHLQHLDVFPIPINTEHEVAGLMPKNIILVTKELSI